MAGYVWIVVGLIACAFGTFALGYGWHILSKDQSEPPSQIAGDYIIGDKTVVNQTVRVGGDFIQIGSPVNTDSTRAFVDLVLNVSSFISQNKSSVGDLTVEDYMEWARKRYAQGFDSQQPSLLNVLEGEAGQASVVKACINDVMIAVQDQSDRLGEIISHTTLLPDIDSKLDYLIEELSRKESSLLREGQLAVSARVLSALNEGIIGSGARIMMQKRIDPREGSAMVVWLLGTQSPHMMLLDLVGDIRTNRLSVILNENASIGIRAYDSAGKDIKLVSDRYSTGQRLVIIAAWKDCRLALWINGDLQASATMSRRFDYLGPVCLAGLDIDGVLSADAVRWSPEGEDMGLNFKKDGIWHGSRYDTLIIWNRILEEQEIKALAEDPWVMFRKGG